MNTVFGVFGAYRPKIAVLLRDFDYFGRIGAYRAVAKCDARYYNVFLRSFSVFTIYRREFSRIWRIFGVKRRVMVVLMRINRHYYVTSRILAS